MRLSDTVAAKRTPPRLQIVPPQSCRRVSQLPQVRPVQSAFDVALRSLGERERRQVWHRGYDDRVDLGELGADVLRLRPVVRPIALVELFLMAIGCPGRVSFRRIRLGSTPADRELGRQGDQQLQGADQVDRAALARLVASISR